MCEAILHSHTGLRVSTNFQGGNFLIKVAFPKKRGFLSSRLSRCPTTRAARPVRHNAGGVFLRHSPASSPSCSPSNRPGSCPGSKVPNYNHAQTRRRRTTRLRVHAGKTSRRRPAQAQRAAVTDSQERPPSEPCSRPAVTVANYMFLRPNYILRWLHFGFSSVS